MYSSVPAVRPQNTAPKMVQIRRNSTILQIDLVIKLRLVNCRRSEMRRVRRVRRVRREELWWKKVENENCIFLDDYIIIFPFYRCFSYLKKQTNTNCKSHSVFVFFLNLNLKFKRCAISTELTVNCKSCYCHLWNLSMFLCMYKRHPPNYYMPQDAWACRYYLRAN